MTFTSASVSADGKTVTFTLGSVTGALTTTGGAVTGVYIFLYGVPQPVTSFTFSGVTILAHMAGVIPNNYGAVSAKILSTNNVRDSATPTAHTLTGATRTATNNSTVTAIGPSYTGVVSA